ncbi:unnamed protein product [Prorocentrum cordatum]|uniref:Uncharacterized protein n=1 Tax=Prorocentrum cordatum TaxID=2364126 RepID=A0ABN9SVE0_9DINO|nr:unnamed protein product [Polarella glacialis]
MFNSHQRTVFARCWRQVPPPCQRGTFCGDASVSILRTCQACHHVSMPVLLSFPPCGRAARRVLAAHGLRDPASACVPASILGEAPLTTSSPAPAKDRFIK